METRRELGMEEISKQKMVWREGGQTELWCSWGMAEGRKPRERQKNVAYPGDFGQVSFIVRALEAEAVFHHQGTSHFM